MFSSEVKEEDTLLSCNEVFNSYNQEELPVVTTPAAQVPSMSDMPCTEFKFDSESTSMYDDNNPSRGESLVSFPAVQQHSQSSLGNVVENSDYYTSSQLSPSFREVVGDGEPFPDPEFMDDLLKLYG